MISHGNSSHDDAAGAYPPAFITVAIVALSVVAIAHATPRALCDSSNFDDMCRRRTRFCFGKFGLIDDTVYRGSELCKLYMFMSIACTTY